MLLANWLRGVEIELVLQLPEFRVDAFPLLLGNGDVGSRLVDGALDLILIAGELGGESNATAFGGTFIRTQLGMVTLHTRVTGEFAIAFDLETDET